MSKNTINFDEKSRQFLASDEEEQQDIDIEPLQQRDNGLDDLDDLYDDFDNDFKEQKEQRAQIKKDKYDSMRIEDDEVIWQAFYDPKVGLFDEYHYTNCGENIIKALGHVSDAELYDCLLYTSPSPRD